MLLVIDAGNTNIVLAAMDGYEVCRQARLITDRSVDTERCFSEIREAMEGLTFDGAILSSVVPEVNGAFCAAAKKLTGRECLVLDYTTKTDMPLLVDEPATIGADIIAGCFAAKEHYPLPLAVADLGTANTVMVVDKDGAFRGGIIAAGLKMQLQALGAGTSLLPNLEVSAPEKCIGTNTVDCLESGAVYGAAAMLDGIVARMEQEVGEPLTLVATGGLSGLVCEHCRHEVHVEPELLLKGLTDIYKRNTAI